MAEILFCFPPAQYPGSLLLPCVVSQIGEQAKLAGEDRSTGLLQ